MIKKGAIDQRGKEFPKEKDYRIYMKGMNRWVSVSESLYREFYRYTGRLRGKAGYNGQCGCPKGQFWRCDLNCEECSYYSGSGNIYLDVPVGDSSDGAVLGDLIADPAPDCGEQLYRGSLVQSALNRLDEIMPVARQIGELRLDGLTDGVIAEKIGIKRTTFVMQLKKAKGILMKEFPDLF